MKYSDHYILAKYLAASYNINNLYNRIPFIVGNVLPDINKFTYLQGYNRLPDNCISKLKRLTAGHTAEGSRFYVNKNTNSFRIKYHGVNAKKAGFLAWYRMGVLMHYVTDRFTYPHTLASQMTFTEHVTYEESLHETFSSLIKQLYYGNYNEKIKSLVRGNFRKIDFNSMYKAFRSADGEAGKPLNNCLFIIAVSIKYMDYVMPRHI